LSESELTKRKKTTKARKPTKGTKKYLISEAKTRKRRNFNHRGSGDNREENITAEIAEDAEKRI